MKNTKRSMLVSGLCLLLTAVMLMGSTFAWFTDSVTNGGNTIQAGELKVSFQYKDLDDKDATYQNVPNLSGEAGVLFTGTTWEPGHSNGVDLKVTNTGSLALDWELSFRNIQYTGGKNGAKLGDVIDVYVIGVDAGEDALVPENCKGTLSDLVNGVVTTGTLESGAQPGEFSVVLKMQEDAGNDYQEAQISFDVYLRAKQAQSEVDGFGHDDYDALAEWPDVVYDGQDTDTTLGAVTTEGGTVTLDEGVYQLDTQALNFHTDENVVIEGQGADKTVLNGAISIFSTGSDVSNTYTFRNMTIMANDIAGNTNLLVGPSGGFSEGSKIKIVLENCVLVGSGEDGNIHGVQAYPYADVELRNVTFRDMYCGISVYDQYSDGTPTGAKVNMEDVTFENVKYQYQMFYPAQDSYFADYETMAAKLGQARVDSVFQADTALVSTPDALRSAVTSGEYKKVYVAEGTYSFDNTLVVTKPVEVIADGAVTLDFSNASAPVDGGYNTNAGLLVLSGDVTFRGVTVYGKPSQDGAVVIVGIDDASNAGLQDNKITVAEGMVYDFQWETGEFASDNKNVYENVNFYNCTIGLKEAGTVSSALFLESRYTVVKDCTFVNVQAKNAVVKLEEDHTKVLGCTFTGCTGKEYAEHWCSYTDEASSAYGDGNEYPGHAYLCQEGWAGLWGDAYAAHEAYAESQGWNHSAEQNP